MVFMDGVRGCEDAEVDDLRFVRRSVRGYVNGCKKSIRKQGVRR